MIVAFLDCHMVVKSKSLLSTPAVQPVVDPQDVCSLHKPMSHGKDIRTFVSDNGQG